MEIEAVSFPQLSTDQKLAVREAQFQIVAAQNAVQQASVAYQQTIEKIGKEVSADFKTMLFNPSTLQFIPKNTAF